MTQSPSAQLSERYIQDSFHSYLKSSLTQAKAERLLDSDVLSSAESDLMIIGPALCLYFAALRCTTNPPSVPLPRSKTTGSPIDLSPTNCPPLFLPFLLVWSYTVPSIQSMPPESQHDLARVICGLDPISSPLLPSVGGIAADLRAVAIEISQRRSFQDRFADDLQAALDSGGRSGGGGGRKKATFVPPPLYEPTPTATPIPSPRSEVQSLPPSRRPQSPTTPTSPTFLSPASASTSSISSSSRHRSRSPSPSPSSSSSSSSFSSRIISEDTPAIDLIRETLYASLADALESRPSLRSLLSTDPPRAYFASVSFAILSFSTTRITPNGDIIGVLGTKLTLAECPEELRPFMREIKAIGEGAKEMRERDDEKAVKAAMKGDRDMPTPRMERVERVLEEGVGYAYRDGYDGRRRSGSGSREGRRSVEGRAVAFANRISALALGMTRLRAFRERQKEVFKVLASVGSV